jgi:hypothetical protein
VLEHLVVDLDLAADLACQPLAVFEANLVM